VADYNDTTGKTFSAASGSVRANNKAFGVIAAKPSEIARDSVHAYRLGQILPAAIVNGRVTISTMTVKAPTVNWRLFVQANPNWLDIEVEAMVNYNEPGVGTAPFNHKRCRIVKATPGESDSTTTSEVVTDIELLPLSAEQFGKVGTTR
jgi:hypothetical protein